MPEREHAAKLYTEINGLRQDSEAREFVVADLRRQVIDLLPSKHAVRFPAVYQYQDQYQY